MRHAIGAIVLSFLLAGLPGLTSAQTAPPPAGGPFSISAEALLWWFKGNAAPPLVTDDVLSEPGVKTYLGGDDLDTNPNPGFRLSAAYALTPRWGVEGSFFYIPTRSTSRSVSSSGQPGSLDLFIPFVDANLPAESVTELSETGFFSGRATEELSNNLLGAELNGTMRLPAMGAVQMDLIGGFRYLRLHETYTFSTNSPNIPPQPADVFQTTDEFDTTNNFYGLQIGARGRATWGRFFVTGAVKVGLGAMVQSAEIDGQLVTNDFNNFGTPQTFKGGYFAQPTNMGTHTRSVFAVVPEVTLNLGYQITSRLSVFAGYNFLYASSVLRAPGQVNRNLNPFLIPAASGELPVPIGPAEPSYKFDSSGFWAQGLNLGLTFRF